MNLKVKLLTPSAKAPTRATAGSAGLDLYADLGGADAELYIYEGQQVLIKTGVAIELPDGYEAQVRGRSGLAKLGLVCHVGTIDQDYRGDIGVILFAAVGEHRVLHGDRIGQLVVAACVRPEVEVVGELGETGRGAGGFGSSGR
jgi:dUTP pyrophosphatase